MKREGRLSENAILNSRIIDRPIRPMFPKGTLNEVQIIATMLSSSGASDYGFHGITGASLALMLAGCTQFEGPVAGARIARMKDGSYVFDPKFEELAACELDLTVAGTLDAITMVESQCNQVDDKIMLEAFDKAFAYIKELCQAQLDFVEVYKKTYELPKVELIVKEKETAMYEKAFAMVSKERMEKLYFIAKKDFEHGLETIEEEIIAEI